MRLLLVYHYREERYEYRRPGFYNHLGGKMVCIVGSKYGGSGFDSGWTNLGNKLLKIDFSVGVFGLWLEVHAVTQVLIVQMWLSGTSCTRM